MSYCQFSVRNDCVTRLDCLKQSSPPYHLGLVRKSFMCGLVDFILNFSGFCFSDWIFGNSPQNFSHQFSMIVCKIKIKKLKNCQIQNFEEFLVS